MTRRTLKALLVLALAVPVLAGVPAALGKPPASEEYVFEGPNAGASEGTAGSTEDDGSDAAVPIVIGVLVVTAAAGAVIAIVRRQRT